MDQKRIIKALILGAILGLTYEFIVNPYINKPISKEIEKVL